MLVGALIPDYGVKRVPKSWFWCGKTGLFSVEQRATNC
jgi:hypothetical protein